MSESTGNLDEMEQQNYSMSSTNMDPKNNEELIIYVQSLLQNVQDRFQSMSEQIISRIDDMGNRIDDLEKSISDLMTQAGVEGHQHMGDNEPNIGINSNYF